MSVSSNFTMFHVGDRVYNFVVRAYGVVWRINTNKHWIDVQREDTGERTCWLSEDLCFTH